MKQVNKAIKQKLTTLLIIGIIIFASAAFAAYLLFISASSFPLIYTPLTIFASVLGSLLAIRLDPGGQLNFYLAAHKRTEEEQQLYDLIKKNRNNWLVILTPVFFTVILIIIDIYVHAKENFF